MSSSAVVLPAGDHPGCLRVRPVVRSQRAGGVTAARDLVRTREDVRGELMRARHRVSKLLLRYGVVYGAGRAWTLRHHAWLATRSFDQRAVQVAFEIAGEQVLLVAAGRDRLDAAISQMARDSQWTPVVTRPGCLRGISTLTGFALAVEIGTGTVHRLEHRRVHRAGPGREFQRHPAQPDFDHQGRQHARPAAAGRGGPASPRSLPGAGGRAAHRWDVAPAAARARGHQDNLRRHRR